MPQMKWIMYLMPIMFLGFFNNYAAGLTYYYFLANMFTMTQQFFMKKFVDEKAILAKIEENKKKPAKPKSSFQKKLEEIQRKQEQKMRARQRKIKNSYILLKASLLFVYHHLNYNKFDLSNNG